MTYSRAVLDDAIADGAIDGTGTMTDGTYDMIILCLHQRIAIQMVQEALPKIPARHDSGRHLRSERAYGAGSDLPHFAGKPMCGMWAHTLWLDGRKTATTPAFPTCSRTPTSLSTPVDGTDEAALDTVRELADQMGFGKIVTATPMWHDNMIAYTSQLAHVVSSSYVKDFCMDDALSFSGGGFQDMTRVATMDESM